jgi:ribulose-5-phosphate 4-epimerase/fuculose-1-phosphate aldolase
MRHHGIAVAARSLAESVILAMMLEDACRIQLLATAAGGPADLFPPDDIKRLYDKITQPAQFDLNFEYLRRKASRVAAAW